MTLRDSYLKALNPTISVKVANLDKGIVPKGVIKDLHQVLSFKYETFLDEENGVIYIGKRT